MIDILSNLQVSDAGLELINFMSWSRLDKALDSTIIQNFATNINQLKEFKFWRMKTNNDDVRDSLAELAQEIIKNAEGLTEVSITENDFSESATTMVIVALSQSPCIETLEELTFSDSAYFSDESCEALADFLASAVALTNCWIKPHKGRQLKVDQHLSREPRVVEITDRDTNEVFRRETKRTQNHQCDAFW